MKKKRIQSTIRTVNDEGIEVPVTSSGLDKHGAYPETSSNAITSYMALNEKTIPAIEIYWEVYEQYPIDGGDYYRSICWREREEDAQAIVKVLEETDVLWSCYGYRKVEYNRNARAVCNEKSWWDRICNFFKCEEDYF